MKEIYKILIIIGLITMYLLNFLFMFETKPLNILIANIFVWILILVLPLIVEFIEYLNS